MARKEPFGRPTIYTEELAQLICERVASCTTGLSILCKTYDDLPSPDTIYQWRHKNKDFSERYLKARRCQSHFLAEQVKDIAEETRDYIYEDEKGARKIDAGIVALQKFRMNANTWLASRIDPENYGERVINENKNENAGNIEDIAKRVSEINKEKEQAF